MDFVFIVGVGRSGTSLLQAMLDSHPKIRFLPETLFARQHVFAKPNSSTDTVSKDTVMSNTRLREIFGGGAELAAFWAAQTNCTALSLYENLHRHLQTDQADWSGDKDPRLLEKTQNIIGCFPNAKIIQIMRDPRDTICSKLKADWAKKRPWWLHTFITAYQIGFYQENSTTHHRVFYEDLLANPQATLEEICDFLDLTYDPAMIDYTASAQSLMRESEKTWKENTTKPLMQSNSGNWGSKLSPFQVRFIDKLCLQAAWLRGHYMPASTKLSLPKEAAIACASLTLFCLSKMKRTR